MVALDLDHDHVFPGSHQRGTDMPQLTNRKLELVTLQNVDSTPGPKQTERRRNRARAVLGPPLARSGADEQKGA